MSWLNFNKLYWLCHAVSQSVLLQLDFEFFSKCGKGGGGERRVAGAQWAEMSGIIVATNPWKITLISSILMSLHVLNPSDMMRLWLHPIITMRVRLLLQSHHLRKTQSGAFNFRLHFHILQIEFQTKKGERFWWRKKLTHHIRFTLT